MPVVKVKGMSCSIARTGVTEAMQGLGAKEVKVDLLSGDVTYEEDAMISPEAIKALSRRSVFEVA